MNHFEIYAFCEFMYLTLFFKQIKIKLLLSHAWYTRIKISLCARSSPPLVLSLPCVPGGMSATAPLMRQNARQAYICMHGLLEIQQMCVCVCVIMYSEALCHHRFPSSVPSSLWSMLPHCSPASTLFVKCRKLYQSSIMHSLKPVAYGEFACNPKWVGPHVS